MVPVHLSSTSKCWSTPRDQFLNLFSFLPTITPLVFFTYRDLYNEDSQFFNLQSWPLPWTLNWISNYLLGMSISIYNRHLTCDEENFWSSLENLSNPQSLLSQDYYNSLLTDLPNFVLPCHFNLLSSTAARLVLLKMSQLLFLLYLWDDGC